MWRAGGYLVGVDVDGGLHEADTFTCFHCNKVVIVKPKCDPAELGGMCRICCKMICPSCVDLGRCDPMEEKLARAEQSEQARRSYGI